MSAHSKVRSEIDGRFARCDASRTNPARVSNLSARTFFRKTMKTRCFIWWFALAVCGALSLKAQTTVFTYQGRLNDGANPAEGVYDLQFALHDGPTNGTLVAGPQM